MSRQNPNVGKEGVGKFFGKGGQRKKIKPINQSGNQKMNKENILSICCFVSVAPAGPSGDCLHRLPATDHRGRRTCTRPAGAVEGGTFYRAVCLHLLGRDGAAHRLPAQLNGDCGLPAWARTRPTEDTACLHRLPAAGSSRARPAWFAGPSEGLWSQLHLACWAVRAAVCLPGHCWAVRARPACLPRPNYKTGCQRTCDLHWATYYRPSGPDLPPRLLLTRPER
ncbi:hypothetical protein AVEN_2750-1 [Araneus ventricosus]|uniref:Uncharacterized protein n=1 Tax=Araneus ventricosus TaxID=182803 RepID=A0A4Y2VDT9_ARAVE|nr:hypothetical protein AVEN_2750-1 [Araneus ventricosus]